MVWDLPERVTCEDVLFLVSCAQALHGGYGEVVITLVCGTGVMGSIPVSRPIETILRFNI